MSSEPQCVLFRGGFSASALVVRYLLDLEQRGATFEPLPGGQFRVVPASLLTVDDARFLAAHRDEARRILAYQADDEHLFTDRRPTDGTPIAPQPERVA